MGKHTKNHGKRHKILEYYGLTLVVKIFHASENYKLENTTTFFMRTVLQHAFLWLRVSFPWPSSLGTGAALFKLGWFQRMKLCFC